MMAPMYYTRVRDDAVTGEIIPLGTGQWVPWHLGFSASERSMMLELIELGARVHCSNWYEV